MPPNEAELVPPAGPIAGPTATEPKARPWLFALLIAPMAVLSNGIVSGALSYLLRQQGVSTDRASAIIALLVLPQTIYFLWSPLTDFFVQRRTWLIAGAFAGAAVEVAAFQQPNLSSRATVGLMFLAGCCAQLVVSSCGGMMGALKGERNRRTAGSFYQGGSLAFGAIAIFALTLLAGKMSQARLGWVAAGLIALPSLIALLVPAQERIADAHLGAAMRRVWDEFRSTFLRWSAVPYTLCMIFPMASGAAMGLLPGVAQDYGVNAAKMAWMNGVAGALLMAAGALAATLIPPRVRASVGYLTVALVNAAALTVLWLGPPRPATYYLGVTLYLFSVGTCYAMFTAVILEFLGASGKSGSGRYAIINSLGNVPVAYMTRLDGLGAKTWGARGLAGTEAVVGAAGAALLLLYFLRWGRRNQVSDEPL